METLEVDGSYGEGGGQILRTAVAFSIILGRPIHVTKIRAGRGVPGLRAQHASTLRLLRDISGSELRGGEVGSTEVWFRPGNVESASMHVDMKTAASITLALQAVIPAVSLSGSSMELEIVGGTDVPWSPTFDYLAKVVRDCFERAGVHFSATALSRGYYPVGGGLVRAAIQKAQGVNPLQLTERRGGLEAFVVSRCGSLPDSVAQRQASAALSLLRSANVDVGGVKSTREPSRSPGSSILVSSSGPGHILGSDSIGARGKRAEAVGREAAQRFIDLFLSGSSVDQNLADMVAPFLMLADDSSNLLIPRSTPHLTTSLYVASLFTGGRYETKSLMGRELLTVIPGKRF